MHGGKPMVSQPIIRMDGKLSGYLAGSERGGPAVQRLEEVWAIEFKAKHAIACNSGTSAILAALAAVGVARGTRVIVPTMCMSAAPAMVRWLGAQVVFHDVDDWFCLEPTPGMIRTGDVILAVNLFGHPVQLRKLHQMAVHHSADLIEDACQSPWASEGGYLAGTVGHLGCFSFNVHKPISAGEGGMVVTNDDAIALRVRGYINHAEKSTYASNMVGGNLRMIEPVAKRVIEQIEPGRWKVRRCQQIWGELLKACGGIFSSPGEREGCVSACYCFPLLIDGDRAARDWAVEALNAEGVPCRGGYELVHEYPYFRHCYGKQTFAKAEALNDRLILIELVGIEPTGSQIGMMCDAIRSIAEEFDHATTDRARAIG